ncbi:MAG: endonuclease/exonuclease/phosphatase family protein, partial [Pseudoxanthomonas suwonensis]|nr:endonuclease/exonuclease/phosphatase family protein [Pseudoxanthomonas suwonensis]
DWNIVRTARDIRNWKGNQKNSGCLPHERAWLSGMIDDDCHDGLASPRSGGWKDSYRVLHPQGEDYTWWSQRGAARAKNVGWRIDYQLVTPALARRIRHVEIFPEPKFSDHAPYLVEYDMT